MMLTDQQRAKEEEEREKARAIRKASLEHWTEKYRYYSHPPADKIGINPCDKFDKMKTEEMWERAYTSKKELADPRFRCRPTGAFKQLICQSVDPAKTLERREGLSFEQTMARVRTSLDISRQKTWHQNRPTWGKYNFYSGGSQSSARFSNWMGQFSGKSSDVCGHFMETRLEDLQKGDKTPSQAAEESYHPFRTLEFRNAQPAAVAAALEQAPTTSGGKGSPALAKSMSSPQVQVK